MGMADTALKRMSRDEFLAWDEQQPDRYEFIAGEIHAMTGGSRAHGDICFNLVAAFKRALAGTRCTAHVEGLKVEVGDDFVYPDVLVTCEPLTPRDLLVREPRLVGEVISPSTEVQGPGPKRLAYQRLPSWEYYLLVSQDKPLIELFFRREGRWDYDTFDGSAARVPLPALGIELALAAVYAGALTSEPGATHAG